MKILLIILLGYAVFFYLLSREGIEVRENLLGFVLLAPLITWIIALVNWLFGTEFGEEVVFFIWLGLFLAWTLVGIWFLIDKYWKRRIRNKSWRRILKGGIA